MNGCFSYFRHLNFVQIVLDFPTLHILRQIIGVEIRLADSPHTPHIRRQIRDPIRLYMARNRLIDKEHTTILKEI